MSITRDVVVGRGTGIKSCRRLAAKRELARRRRW